VGVDDAWIFRRTGVRQRHATDRSYADDPMVLPDLGAAAGGAALQRAGVAPEDLDYVIFATGTHNERTPNAAPRVAGELGIRCGAFDVGGACSGFVVGLATATGLIESGRASHVLLLGGDIMSWFIDYDDRGTASLFGDGVGAVVMRAVPGPGYVGPATIGSDGTLGHIIHSPSVGKLQMQGAEVFKHANLRMVQVTREAAQLAGLELDEIDLFVYHQANGRILEVVAEELGLPPERVVNSIERYGNTTAGTIPIALSEAYDDGRLRPGARVLVGAFGAGLTWGALVVTWDPLRDD
jgi:3-oxoacyl-[acyl-carrier-protein] synthase-3